MSNDGFTYTLDLDRRNSLESASRGGGGSVGSYKQRSEGARKMSSKQESVEKTTYFGISDGF